MNIPAWKLKMNLWHDDIRRPPEGYDGWARTNSEARAYLFEGAVKKISLDHDLGLDQDDPDAPNAINMIGRGDETGRQLVMWMVENDCVPDEVEIHTMNPVGGDWMEGYLHNAWLRNAISNTPKITRKPFGIA